jgi:hypothetical protein
MADRQATIRFKAVGLADMKSAVTDAAHHWEQTKKALYRAEREFQQDKAKLAQKKAGGIDDPELEERAAKGKSRYHNLVRAEAAEREDMAQREVQLARATQDKLAADREKAAAKVKARRVKEDQDFSQWIEARNAKEAKANAAFREWVKADAAQTAKAKEAIDDRYQLATGGKQALAIRQMERWYAQQVKLHAGNRAELAKIDAIYSAELMKLYHASHTAAKDNLGGGMAPRKGGWKSEHFGFGGGYAKPQFGGMSDRFTGMFLAGQVAGDITGDKNLGRQIGMMASGVLMTSLPMAAITAAATGIGMYFQYVRDWSEKAKKSLDAYTDAMASAAKKWAALGAELIPTTQLGTKISPFIEQYRSEIQRVQKELDAIEWEGWGAGLASAFRADDNKKAMQKNLMDQRHDLNNLLKGVKAQRDAEEWFALDNMRAQNTIDLIRTAPRGMAPGRTTEEYTSKVNYEADRYQRAEEYRQNQRQVNASLEGLVKEETRLATVLATAQQKVVASKAVITDIKATGNVYAPAQLVNANAELAKDSTALADAQRQVDENKDAIDRTQRAKDLLPVIKAETEAHHANLRLVELGNEAENRALDLEQAKQALEESNIRLNATGYEQERKLMDLRNARDRKADAATAASNPNQRELMDTRENIRKNEELESDKKRLRELAAAKHAADMASLANQYTGMRLRQEMLLAQQRWELELETDTERKKHLIRLHAEAKLAIELEAVRSRKEMLYAAEQARMQARAIMQGRTDVQIDEMNAKEAKARADKERGERPDDEQGGAKWDAEKKLDDEAIDKATQDRRVTRSMQLIAPTMPEYQLTQNKNLEQALRDAQKEMRGGLNEADWNKKVKDEEASRKREEAGRRENENRLRNPRPSDAVGGAKWDKAKKEEEAQEKKAGEPKPLTDAEINKRVADDLKQRLGRPDSGQYMDMMSYSRMMQSALSGGSDSVDERQLAVMGAMDKRLEELTKGVKITGGIPLE